MDIRAHHLVCIKSFKGKGYSKKFVNNFYQVINKIKNNPIVEITNKPDIICKACPYNKNGCIKKGLNSEVKVRNKDNKIIKLLKINLNKKIKARNITELINKNITKKHILKICKDCEWLKYCV
jgi:hypothetical protein